MNTSQTVQENIILPFGNMMYPFMTLDDNAEIVKILEPSEHRVEPKCHYYGKCGGCNMMHIDSDYQKLLRKQMLIDIFRQNGIDIADKTKIIV